MPKHNTERAQGIRARNVRIVLMVNEGNLHRDVAESEGISVAAVGGVMTRSREFNDGPLSVQQTTTEKSRKQRDMAEVGIEHVAGWIYAKDKPKFRRLVAKAAPVVERVTKGDE